MYRIRDKKMQIIEIFIIIRFIDLPDIYIYFLNTHYGLFKTFFVEQLANLFCANIFFLMQLRVNNCDFLPRGFHKTRQRNIGNMRAFR